MESLSSRFDLFCHRFADLRYNLGKSFNVQTIIGDLVMNDHTNSVVLDAKTQSLAV